MYISMTIFFGENLEFSIFIATKWVNYIKMNDGKFSFILLCKSKTCNIIK